MSVPEQPGGSKLKAFTIVTTAVVSLTLVCFDWSKTSPGPTVFDNIRPALRSVVNRFYGVQPSGKSPTLGDQEDSSS